MKQVVAFLAAGLLAYTLWAEQSEPAVEARSIASSAVPAEAPREVGPRARATVVSEPARAPIPVGVTQTYRLEHQSTQSAPLVGAMQLTGSSSVSAHVAMTGLEPEIPGTVATRLSLSSVESFELTLEGASGQGGRTQLGLEDARQALLGHAAIATWDAEGTPKTVAFSPGASPLFVSLIQGLVLDTQIHLRGPGRRWTTTEVGLQGEYRAVWTRADDRGRDFTRTLGVYTHLRAFPDGAQSSVQGETRLTLAPGGGIESLVRTETLTATAGERRLSVDSRLVLTLAGSVQADVASGATPDGWHRQSAVVLSVGEAARLRALEARVAGLTLTDVQSAIRLADTSAPTADTTAFLWRAVGLLKLDPSLATAVGELAADPDTSEAGRALALDLLVSTGHSSAQAALRAAIASRAGKADAAACVTRLALVQEPDAATVDMALGELTGVSDATTPETRDAAALAVGALADWTRRGGDSERSNSLVSALTERLDGAKTPADLVTGLRALGNAGGDAILDAVKSHVGHADAEVRAAAALALRDVPPASSAPVLTDLLADPDADVQHAALTSLFEQTLEDDEQSQVAWKLLDALAAGTVSPRLHAQALEFADQRVADPALAVKLAEAVRAASQEPTIRTAANSVIAALTAAL